MDEIYRFNPDARYSPKQYPGDINSLSHMRVYVNEYQYVTVDFPDIFSDYKIILGKDLWSLLNDLFYQLQSRPTEAH